MALSKDDRARLIKSGKLARTALAAARMGTRTAPHSGDADSASTETPLPGEITDYLRGALLVEDAGDGLVQPYRFSKKQLRYLDSVGRGRRARATSGICLAFVTTGNEVSFDCRVTSALDPAHPLYAEVMKHLGSLGQAEDGDSGHVVHIFGVECLKNAVDRLGDAAYDPASAERYGTYEVPKVYLHLYGEPEDMVTLDYDVPLEHFGGATGFEIAELAFQQCVSQYREGRYEIYGADSVHDSRRFGLYRSLVGPDTEKTDLFENLP